jgi:parallel beta-helix repeat protein
MAISFKVLKKAYEWFPTFEPGPGEVEYPVSYTIFKDGELIKALNGKTGRVEFSGTDASTVIQSALNALTSGRTWKERVVLKGDFTISSKVTLPNYLVLDLRGAKLTLADGVSDNMFDTVTAKNDIEIIGGILDGNKANQTAGEVIFIQGATSTNIKIIGVTIQNATERAIRVEDAADIEIKGCLIKNSGDRHIVLGRVGRVKIIGNTLDTNDANPAILVSSSGGDSYKVEIKDNVILTSYLSAILFDGDYSQYDHEVEGNIIDDAGQSGIWINSANLGAGKFIARIKIIGNMILNAGKSVRGASLDAVLVGTSNDMVIADNIIYRPSADGISTVGMSNSTIVGNTIAEAGYESGAGQGILVRLGYGVAIKGNSIRLSKHDGIRLSGSSFCIVEGNTIENSSQAANNTYRDIYISVDGVTNSTYNVIAGNTCRNVEANKPAYNIAESDSSQDYQMVESNILSGAVTRPLNLQGPNTIVKHNIGYVTENSGTATVTGDGVATTFTVDVAHGLVIDTAATKITLDRDGTVDKAYLVDTDADGFKETLRIQVTFATAPALDDSVPIYWEAQAV